MNTIRAALAALVSLASSSSLLAITGGMADTNNTFGNVGIFFAHHEDGRRIHCSSTLIHPRVVLTAGHCTSDLFAFVGSEDRLFVSFEPVNARTNGLRAVQAVITHPAYDPDSIKSDVGLVILKEPAPGILPSTLPPRGTVLPYLEDQWRQGNLLSKSGRADLWVAGYGRGVALAPYEQFPIDGTRRFGLSAFKSLIPGFLFITQHEAPGISVSGVCFGDSGGPSFYQDPNTGAVVQITVTSWGGNCLGFAALQRLDLFHILDFIHGVLADVDAGKY